jgi:hypothetical protein
MLSIVIRGTKNAVRTLEREKESMMARVAKDTLEVVKQKTPIDKGQARRGWRLENAYQQKRIVNRVPYIVALEEGHSKKQAPKGIIGPTIREISKRRYK